MLLKEISLFITMEILLNQYHSLEEYSLYAGQGRTLLSGQHNIVQQLECIIALGRL